MEEEAKVTWDRAVACGERMEEARTEVVKINFDATATGRKMSFSLVARDHDGFVLGGRADVLDRNVQAEWAKLYVLEESINLARAKNWLRLEFESNYASLVNRLSKTNVDFSTMGYRIRELIKLLDPSFSFNFV
ncbi:hypothetical protein Goari_006269 [Gossypium aridum]|uniref:RNase H type-1 domain-containing protein n=1 Tax=Gossypium aridum TaxID=34290 RepID=A0A7J8XMK5_GOSAI|nr:hypothetical protein [Gossypium aridum]